MLSHKVVDGSHITADLGQELLGGGGQQVGGWGAGQGGGGGEAGRGRGTNRSFNRSGLGLAGCVPHLPDPVAAEEMGDGHLAGHV